MNIGWYWEGLNGRLESDDSVTVLGVPAYVYDLGLGDRVTTVRSGEGSLVATNIAHAAGNHTFRFYLLDADDETRWYPLATEFAVMGCLIDVLSPHFIALSCISEASHSVTARLAELGDEGILEYEIGRTSGLGP